MNKCYLLFLFLTIGIFNDAKSQEKNSKKNADTDNSMLIIGADYFSNTNTLGIHNNESEQPSISPTVNFYSKSGIFATAAFLIIQNADSTLSNNAHEGDLQVGYRWDINSAFSLTPSLAHFIYSKNTNALRSGYSDCFDLTFDAQSKWVFGSLSTSYAIGKPSAFILDAQAGLNIQFENFLGHDHSLLIQPSIDFNFNNQEYYNKYAQTYFPFLRTYAENHPNATIGDYILFLEKHPKINYLERHPRIKKAFDKLDPNTIILSLFEVKTKFTLSSIGVIIPLVYTVNNFSFKLSFAAYKPLNQPSFLPDDWSIMANLGMNYTFSW